MAGGYYHTGDLADRDADGYITYVGRTDDVFKASDYKVSPFELESVLIEHPAVVEAAVVPAPDPVRLAVPKAYVALAAGREPDEATASRSSRTAASTSRRSCGCAGSSSSSCPRPSPARSAGSSCGPASRSSPTRVGAHGRMARRPDRAASIEGWTHMTERTVTVRLAYGDKGLDVRLPADRTDLVEPRFQPGVADPRATLAAALRRPGRRPGAAGPSCAPARRSRCRCATPPGRSRGTDDAGAARRARRRRPPDDVTVLVATGTHRGNTETELRAMLGDEVVHTLRIVNHDARDDEHAGVARAVRRRRAGLAQPRLGRGRRPDHDGVRRAALLRRVQRRPEARRARAGRPARPC